ncbi:alpha/beta hydrolase family esterase [Litoreibacter albidus]|uniref:Polyhydroxybutyrate depolymerase n=1 Tax=Litoreibacter albidus TaxID=670155 RepID=A0A1H2V670_9RHOB|nr:prolyl oligopeptidase family serine peptidase [Litoreibacter albidus]SDW63813.1 polyhydroxybutyrate depolymerase [Litoreibacter albidus]
MQFLNTLLAATSLTVAAATSAFGCGADSDCTVGDRTYRIAMPDGHDGTTPVGAIVFSHGYRGSAAGLMRNRNLRGLISDMGLALIALKSKGDDWVLPNSPRHMDSTGAAEFSYVDAVIADASSRHPLDQDRLVAAGFSAGGMMTWNLACARPALFAGFVPISGTFWKQPPPSCAGPVASIVHIHGDADPTVPMDGRPIMATRQGKVTDALDMYRDFGDFTSTAPSRTARLSCDNSTNAQGAVLNLCMFEGGHSFRSEFLRYAWETLEDAGRL